MKLKLRQKIALWICVISAFLGLAILFVSPDQVLTGYQVVNGVAHFTYVSRAMGIVSIIGAPAIMGTIWNYVASWNDKKILENPNLQSYRIRGAVINIMFFVWTSLPMYSGCINIILLLL